MGRKYRDHFGVGLMPKDGTPGTAGPLPYPVGVYNSLTEYVRTQKQAPVVMGSDGKYYLLEKFGITKGVNPVSDNTATWTMFDHFQYVFAEFILANFANLAGGIHYNNMLMSQMGVKNGQANSNYQEYTGPSGAWQPNILLDWLTGLIKAKNVDIEGIVNAISGKIGNLIIQDGKLMSNLNGNRIIIDPDGRKITLLNSADQLMGEIVFSSGDVQNDIAAMVEMNHFYQGNKTSSVRIGGVMSDLTIRQYNASGAVIKTTNYRHDGMYVNGVKQEIGGGGGYTHPLFHPASMITEGTFPGIIKANNNTSYTTKQIRNIILSTGNAVSSQMENGDIWIKYE